MFQDFMDFLDPEEAEKRRLAEQRKKAYRDSVRGASVNSDTSGVQELADQMATQHFGAQNDAISAVNNVIAQEMQSRVNQQREMRRMAHAQEMERMRAEAMLKRLQAEQEAQERMMQMKRDMDSGVMSRIRIDGRGRVTST